MTISKTVGPFVSASTVCLLVYWTIVHPTLLSDSFDLGWHWLLTEHVSFREAAGQPHTSETLGVMATYPPGAHFLAGLLSFPIGSEIRAMHTAAVVAVGSIYMLLIGSLLRTSGLVASLAFLAGAMLLARARMAVGHEIVGNYFYPQLIATAAAVLGLILIVTQASPARQYTAALGVTFLIGFIFPAMAIVTAAAYGLGILSTTRWSRASLTNVALKGVGLLVTIVLNPYFWPMVSNAQHEGHSTVPFPSWTLAGLGGATLAAFFISRKRVNKLPSVLLVSAYLGAGFSFATIAQYAAALMGSGGSYAVSKYAFGMATFSFAAAVAMISPRLVRIDREWVAFAAATLFAAAATLATRNNVHVDLHRIIQNHEEARSLLRSPGEQLAGNVAAKHAGLSIGENFMLAKVGMRAGWSTVVDTLRLNGASDLPDAPHAEFVLVRSGEGADCQVQSSARLSIIRRNCLGTKSP